MPNCVLVTVCVCARMYMCMHVCTHACVHTSANKLFRVCVTLRSSRLLGAKECEDY